MKNLLSYTFLAFFLFQAVLLQAQIRKGFKLMERMRYDEALTAFMENPQSETEATMQAFGLAKLYNEPGFSAFSPIEAYKYYLLAEEHYHQLSYDQRKKLKNISLVLLNNLRRNIEAQAFRMAEAYDNVQDWEVFLLTFEKASAKLKSSAHRQRNALLFEKAQADGSLSAWQDLMQRYGADLKRYNKELFDRADKELFSAYFRLHSVDDFEAFAKQFPASAFAKPCLGSCDASTCLPEQLRCLEENADVNGLFAFAQAYPHTSFQRKAVEALADWLERRGTDEECVRFLDAYAGYTTSAGKVWMRLYDNYKFKHPLFEDLRKFMRIYPKFPYEEKIISDYLDRQTEMYQLVLKEPNWSNCRAFVRSFPDAPHVGSVYTILFDLWMLDHNTYEDIEAFAEMFPDYPYAQDLENAKSEWLRKRAEEVLAEGTVKAYTSFLRKYGSKTAAAPVWMALYESVKREDDSARALERFKARYPDFPYMSQLHADLALRQNREMEVAYAEARKTDKMYAYTSFMQRYPHNPYVKEIEQRMAQIALDHCEPYFCEQYLENFPKGTHSKEVTACLESVNPKSEQKK